MTKLVLPLLLSATVLCARGQDTPDAAHASKAAGNAQPDAQQATPDGTIVAKLKNGKEYTAGEIRSLIAQYPAQVQRSFAQNPVRTLNTILMMKSLAAQARADGLDKKHEFTSGAEFNRLNALAQAELARYRESYRPSPEEKQKFYEDHSDRWEEAKFKAIYVSFSNAPAPPAKPLNAEEAAKAAATRAASIESSSNSGQRTEAEAKARVDGIEKQLTAGAGFAKLAGEFSDDKTSAAKGGDFGTAGRYSPYPEALKKALFALKPGQVSEALREPGGYYILKLESISKLPLSEVQSTIEQELLRDHYNDWVKSIQARYNVDVLDAQYFAGHPPR